MARPKQRRDLQAEAEVAAERARKDPMYKADAALPRCGPDDLAVVVNWERDGTGLRGQVIAENVGRRACRVEGKPEVTPLHPDGSPLPVATGITLELIEPGYVILQPGQRAAARVWWPSCCGHQASDRAQVGWPGGSAVATVHGPTQPECLQGRRSDLYSYWFSLITDPAVPAGPGGVVVETAHDLAGPPARQPPLP
jgi:hypothetical protein